MTEPTRVIVAMTGASATPYAWRLLGLLAEAGIGVELMLSENIEALCRVELGTRAEDELARLYGRAPAVGTARRTPRPPGTDR